MSVQLTARALQSATVRWSYTKGKFTVGVLERLVSGIEETHGRGGESSSKVKAQRSGVESTGRVGGEIREKE